MNALEEASAALRHAVCQPRGHCRVVPPDQIALTLIREAATGVWPVPIREALTRLGRCRACEHYRGLCRHDQGTLTDCQQRRVWLRRLLSTGCRLG